MHGNVSAGRAFHAAGRDCDVLRVSEDRCKRATLLARLMDLEQAYRHGNSMNWKDDAAFILGRGGKTKHKIARAGHLADRTCEFTSRACRCPNQKQTEVSAAQLELHERNSTVEIYGSDLERAAAVLHERDNPSSWWSHHSLQATTKPALEHESTSTWFVLRELGPCTSMSPTMTGTGVFKRRKSFGS